MSRSTGLRVMTGMDRESELALVRRIRAGDGAALEEVHACFNRRLYNFLARLSRRRDVAEDLLEETWLRLVRHSRQLTPETSLGPWLFTVARNLYVSYCRSRSFDSGQSQELLSLWPSQSAEPSPFEQVVLTEMERRLESALASLPPAYREVLLLVGVEGISPVEAAIICGVTPETLRQRLHRARTKLAEALRREQPTLLQPAPSGEVVA